MSQITIENYEDQDFKEMTNLIVSSFKSKFCYSQKLTPDDAKGIRMMKNLKVFAIS